MGARVWLVLVLALVVPHAGSAQPVYSDVDWSEGFRVSCGVPEPEASEPALAWLDAPDRRLVFTLAPGQVGRCGTDAKARHSAPFWERMEVRQDGALAFDMRHRVRFTATLLAGFAGPRETVFQIHAWARGCDAYPPLMIKLDDGRLEILVLRRARSTEERVYRQGRHRRVYSEPFDVRAALGAPLKFRVELDLRGQEASGRVHTGTVSVHLNDEPLADDVTLNYPACAEPIVKFGIYRPGPGVATSRIAFDDVMIESAP